MNELSIFPVLILLFPLLGTIINGLFFPVLFKGFAQVKINTAGGIATFFVFISFVLSLITFIDLTNNHSLVSNSYHWLSFGNFHLNFELKIDRLSSILLLIITGIGTLIHLYSIGYMEKDKGVARYFAYLNLFTFFMLLLVLASNLPIMFFGWEGVGLCSYLLIGFWYSDKEKVYAGEKAFIMNRVGDLCLLLGMFLLFKELGSLTFTEINQIAPSQNISPQTLTLICLLLLAGATGKSAQLPLHTWLPDAMMGPTPVSALIHAATMVTAGVYMIVRLHPLFLLSPTAMQIIAWTGAFTALLAASIGLVQTDIKKVLAYSTISQLGFMFLACGVGAFSAAIFHLVTHAFFKALLFLGAGSVIHACSGEQDMTKMGGLKKFIPQTYALTVIGALALSGLPLFSGFFSKDEILTQAFLFTYNGKLLFFCALGTAFLTALYSARFISLTFLGKENFGPEIRKHIHESPYIMLFPLYLLAIGATVGGFLGLPHLLSPIHFINAWLHPSISSNSILPSENLEWTLMGSSTFIAVAGLLFGFKIAKTKTNFLPDFFQNILEKKYYFDEFYRAVLLVPAKKISDSLGIFSEKYLFDESGVLITKFIKFSGDIFRKTQNGDLQSSLLGMIFGLVLVLIAAFSMTLS